MDPYSLVPSIFFHGCVIQVCPPTQKIVSILFYRVSCCDERLYNIFTDAVYIKSLSRSTIKKTLMSFVMPLRDIQYIHI